MSHEADVQPITIHRDALQAIGVMGAALMLIALAGHAGSDAVLGIVSFSLMLMTMIAAALFLFEGRLDPEKRGSISTFCLPAVGLLGFSLALFVVAGFWSLALCAIALAFLFASCRRLLQDGPFNLIPSAALDFGLVGGIGASAAGLLIAGVDLAVA